MRFRYANGLVVPGMRKLEGNTADDVALFFQI